MVPLRILLSGPGLIGRKHADLVAQSSRSKLAAIVAPLTAKNCAFAQERGVPIFDTIEKCLDLERIDAAIIASPNGYHYEQAMTCLDRSIPLLVEKPLATTSEEAREICVRSIACQTPVLVGHHRTYSSFLPAARDFINSSRFGKPVVMQGAALFYKPDDYFEDGPWRTKLGGGPILINMIHEVGIMQYLFGPIRSVWAESSNARRGFAVEDTAVMGFRFCNGALGTFILSDVAASNRSWEMTTGENPTYPCYRKTECYHFSGTQGSLDFPNFFFRSYGKENPASWWRDFEEGEISVTACDPLTEQFRHFEDVVLNLASPLMPASAGLSNIIVIEAIKMSLKEKCTIDIASISPMHIASA
ncbi:Gfo/Idh/MocA family protein [Acetobacter sp.]|uniref:Gfo/Idh/MocA family protein n=1 Tax=Acetobacter sp. TaxID=440 RepID=UPI0039E90251